MNNNSNNNEFWTVDQWSLIEETIHDELENSRLAHKIIPEVRLQSSARAVSADRFDYANATVDDVLQQPLEERQQSFRLTQQQAEDTDLFSAIVIVRRATQARARDHDDRVFREAIRDPIADAPPEDEQFNNVQTVAERRDPSGERTGDGMVAATAAAVATLDGQGYRSGYVMVAGQDLYQLLYTRAMGSADLPIVAVRGLLEDGPVYRSTVLSAGEGLVLAVGAGRIDRAVALAPTIEFLRIERNSALISPGAGSEFREFRLFERFLPRFKETRSAVLLRLKGAEKANDGAQDGEQAADGG